MLVGEVRCAMRGSCSNWTLSGGNERSARVLRALGLRLEGVHRQHLRKGGVMHDVHRYGRLRGDPE